MVPPPDTPSREPVQGRYLTVKEVAEVLSIGTPAVYTLIQTERLPHVRLHRRIRIDPSALDRWLSERSRGFGSE